MKSFVNYKINYQNDLCMHKYHLTFGHTCKYLIPEKNSKLEWYGKIFPLGISYLKNDYTFILIALFLSWLIYLQHFSFLAFFRCLSLLITSWEFSTESFKHFSMVAVFINGYNLCQFQVVLVMLPWLFQHPH